MKNKLYFVLALVILTGVITWPVAASGWGRDEDARPLRLFGMEIGQFRNEWLSDKPECGSFDGSLRDSEAWQEWRQRVEALRREKMAELLDSFVEQGVLSQDQADHRLESFGSRFEGGALRRARHHYFAQ